MTELMNFLGWMALGTALRWPLARLLNWLVGLRSAGRRRETLQPYRRPGQPEQGSEGAAPPSSPPPPPVVDAAAGTQAPPAP